MCPGIPGSRAGRDDNRVSGLPIVGGLGDSPERVKSVVTQPRLGWRRFTSQRISEAFRERHAQFVRRRRAHPHHAHAAAARTSSESTAT
jgi:hypothetical protein